MTTLPFSLTRRIQSFRYALRGLGVLAAQHNTWVHALATLVVVAAGIKFDVSRLDWIALVIAIALVFATEALNTGLELLADAAVPERHALVGKAKDVAACAVLLSAVGAVVIALLVFGPKLL